MRDLRCKIYSYTEGEFLEMLEGTVNATSEDKSLERKKLKKYLDTLVDHFIKVTEHPKKGDLIFCPNSPENGKPESILKTVREWRRSRGLPLFGDSERTLSRVCRLKIIMFWLSDDFRYEKVTVTIAVIISNAKKERR